MPVQKNIVIAGANDHPIALDFFSDEGVTRKPVVVYAHGFNGFKDWGNFDLIAYQFAKAGFVFVKFNFSHNGTAPETPEDFTNLEAFGNNNYSRQLADLERVVDWVCDPGNENRQHIDGGQISLIGHSMGGGIAILQAAADPRIKKLITWASISECKTPWGSWPEEKMQQWKETGVAFYPNVRTGQQMPMYYQLYEDFINNREILDIQKAITRLSIPILICHGREDPAVPLSSAEQLKFCQPAAELFISSGDHVFGRKHPWTENKLPSDMQVVVDKSLGFLKKSLT